MCDNLKTDRIRCDACRTINLAKANITHPKPDMQVFYDKTCTPAKPCTPLTEHPLNPACIRICSKEEFNLRRSGNPLVPPPKPIPYAHGKLMWAVKVSTKDLSLTGILVGSLYFTYAQGVWGDQQDVTECIKRWQEYMRSINTRRPPNFDQCGKVVIKETTDSLVAPLYSIYKSIVTTSFAGVVKIPVLLKCAYVEYLKAIEKHEEELAKERKIRKRTKMLG